MTEVVPTKDDCKHGGWRTMIDGAGNHFKNQGDCVSYFATKGKNPGALPPATAASPSAAADADSATSPVKHGTAHHDKATGQHATSTPRQGDRASTGPRATTPRTRNRIRRTLPMGRTRSIRNSRPSPSTVGPFGSPKGPIILKGEVAIASRALRVCAASQVPLRLPIGPQPAAFLTRSAICASVRGVSLITANSVGHMSPSSRLASGWKPKVE